MVNVDPAMVHLEMKGIVKTFPGVRALDDVSFDIREGEVHCLLGQNGAGKSTLIKILAGAYQPDAGSIEINGNEVRMSDPQSALKLGVATMYQELDVVDGLTVAENIFLGHEKQTAGLIKRHETRQAARELLEELGHPEIRPSMEVGSLSAAGKQIVSMSRALSHNARVIVMDEPSAVLDSEEVDNLFRVVAQLQKRGVAVVYISHRLDEIRRIGDRITVLKDGKVMAAGLAVADTPTDELIRLMTGKALAAVERLTPPAPQLDAPPLLTVDSLTLPGAFEDINFTVRPGEIVGLAGLVGSGRSEILESIFGARRPTAGTVNVSGRNLRKGSVPQAVAAGLGLCPEERKVQGLLLHDAIYKNITLATFANYARSGFLNERAEKEAAHEQADNLDLRPLHLDKPAGTLSGGNQQKLILARWLLHDCQVLLLDEPTRGVDVGARAEIYELIYRLSAKGTAIVVVSSEIPEVLLLSDRVLVISEGKVVEERPASELTEEQILALVMEESAA